VIRRRRPTTIRTGHEEAARMSTFDARAGTRGARQPSSGILLSINKLVARRVRKGARTPGFGFDILLLTTTGRKSGQPRTSPLGWVSDGNGGWLIAASANGAAHLPAWYHNLAAAPDQASIEVSGTTIPVSAEQLHGTEREAAWQTLTAAIPRFGTYPKKTDREIPVIRLSPRSSQPAQ
jgi:deazaflavin-dependent oxidoreductase (nitroreductase family)